jgi:hypothetical protein
MITLKEWMELVNYRITEGSEYQWQCYGAEAYSLDSWSGDQDGYSLTVIFDKSNQTVYEVTACDYANNRAYRMINPDYKFGYDDEAAGRGVAADQAWDEVNYTDLETDEDFMTKAQAIIAGEPYDTRISIPITLPDDEMLVLMTMAHERDMTFNDFVEDIIRKTLADLETRAAVEGLDQIREEFGVQPKKNKKNKGKIPRRTLALELEGVVADVEEGGGFDAVCMKTLKRVIKQLSRD